MNALIARFKQWLSTLAPRERVMVLGGGAALAVTLLFLTIWEPLLKTHERRQADLDTARVLANRLEEIAAAAQRAPRNGSAAVNRNLSLLAAVDQSAKAGTLSKPPARIQPEGDAEVKVWLEDVPFEALVRWLADLEARYGIRAQTAEIERQSGAGLVNARLSLVRS